MPDQPSKFVWHWRVSLGIRRLVEKNRTVVQPNPKPIGNHRILAGIVTLKQYNKITEYCKARTGTFSLDFSFIAYFLGGQSKSHLVLRTLCTA